MAASETVMHKSQFGKLVGKMLQVLLKDVLKAKVQLLKSFHTREEPKIQDLILLINIQ